MDTKKINKEWDKLNWMMREYFKETEKMLLLIRKQEAKLDELTA